MADRKIFTIEINGIKESTKDIDILLSKLNELQKSINDIAKNGVKIKINSGGGGKKDDTAKEAEETANTLAGLRKELGNLKKELAHTELGTEEWDKLRDKVLAANTRVKEIEQSYGVFSRNVGNYTNSFLAAFNKFPQSVQNTLSGLKNFNANASTLGQQIRTVSKSMEELSASGQENSEAFQALKQTYSELVKAQMDFNDAIEDAKDRTHGLKDITESFEAITGAMQLAAGAASLFGGESEDAVKAIKKMQALQSIANGLKALQTALQRNGALWKVWQKSLAASEKVIKVLPNSLKGTAAGMNATATATRGATTAMNGLKVAIASTGIGLLVVAVGMLVSKLMELSDATERANNAFEALADNIHNKYDNLLDDLAARKQLGLITELDEAEIRLKEARKNVEEFGNLFKKTLNSTKNKYLSIFGNLYEGADKAIQKIREVVKEIDFDDKSIENTTDAINKLNGVLNYIKYENLEVPERVINSIKAMIEAWEENRKAIMNLDQAQTNNLDKTKRAEEEKTKKAQEYADKRYRIEQTLAKNELALQANTLNTRLARLRLERDAEIREAKKSGILVQEQLVDIDNRYKQKTEDETRKWLTELSDSYNAAVNAKMKSANNVLKEQVKSLEEVYQFLSKKIFANDKTFINVDKIKEATDALELFGDKAASNKFKSFIENLKTIYNDSVEEMKKNAVNAVLGSAYDPNEVFPQLIDAEKKYHQTILNTQKEVYDELIKARRKYINDNLEQQKYELKENYTRQRDSLVLEIEQMQKNSELEIDAIAAKNDELSLLDEKYLNDVKVLERDAKLEIVKINEEYNNQMLFNQREMHNEYLTSLSNWLSQIRENLNDSLDNNTNVWNIVNYSKYKKDLERIKGETEQAMQYLLDEKAKLIAEYNSGDIDFETYKDGINQVNNQIKETKKILSENNTQTKNAFGNFLESINVYIEKAIQAYTQVSSALFDKFNADIEAEMDDIDKFNDKLQDLLDKQVDMIESHNDKINDIEGELGSARGDRRDQLIAAYNAEQIARERAFAEQKRIEKEQEQLQKRKEALEKKQRREQHKQQLSQAIASAALATTNAYATQPFVPVGIAMGSLAATLGAVQVGIIASTKYADGGLIKGKSHSEGGVPVVGFSRPIEVEGNEFIINKRTTTRNLELLEYINKQHKRIEVADIIDFYYTHPSARSNVSNTVNNTTNVSNITNRKYENGGQLPIMQGFNLNNQTQRIVVDTSNQPIVVSVEEINKVQQNVRNVKVLAGYE